MEKEEKKHQWIVWDKETRKVIVIVRGVPEEVKKEEVGVALAKVGLWPKIEMGEENRIELVMWTKELPEEMRMRAAKGEGKRIEWKEGK